MPNTFFQSTSDLLEKFDLENEGYFDPLALGDRKVAFSVKRPYPENIRYKPAQSRNGKPDNVAAIWLVYTHPEESNKQFDPEHVPVRVHVSNFSQYRSNHFDYDYEDPSEDTPTEDSVEKSLATPQPIGLEYPEEFFYDHTRDSFLDEKGSLLSGIEVLNRVYTEHCNTIHWLKGIKLK